MQRTNMNIMISTNSKYVEPTLTMLYSLFVNHQNIAMDVYLPYSNLNAEEVNKLSTFVHLFEGKELYPIEISQAFSEKVISHNGISIETYYRILAIELLPESIDKILYLDVDMVIQGSIVDLYEQDIEGFPFLVCEDILGILNDFHEMNKYRMSIPKEYSYFNAGVMLFNLKYLRENECEKKILERIYENFERYEYNDQDVLNEMFFDKLKWIGWDLYNLPPALYYVDVEDLKNNKIRFASYEEMRNASTNPIAFANRYKDISLSMKAQAKIVHYMGLSKPWNRDIADAAIYRVFDEVYYKYNVMARNRVGEGSAEFQKAKSEIIKQLLSVGYSFYYLKNRLNKISDVWLLGSSYAVQGIMDSQIGWLTNISAPSQDLFCDRELVNCMLRDGKTAKACVILLGYYALYDDLSRAGELANIMRITYEPLIGTMNHFEGEHFDITEEIQKHTPYMNRERVQECEEWIDSFFDSNDYFNDLYTRENNDLDYVGQWDVLSNVQKADIGRVRAEKHNRLHKNQTVFEENISVLNDFMSVLDKNGIKAIIIIPPFTEYYRKYLDKSYKEELLTALNRITVSVDFYDLNEIDLFDETDFFDSDHLNDNGAKKLTSIIAEIVDELIGITK